MEDGFIKKVIFDIEKNNKNTHPYNLGIFKNLREVELHPKVTYFVGENGSGKSTLLEAIAIASGFNAEGGTKNFDFKTYFSSSDLYKKHAFKKL